MELIDSQLGPELSNPPSLSNPANLGREDGPPHVTEHRAQQMEWHVSSDSDQTHDSTSASTSSVEQETRRDSSDCERMIEKWRLIRLADKDRVQKKIYPTHQAFTSTFGRNYSKVFEAFRQGITTPRPRPNLPDVVPAKRLSEPVTTRTSKRRRPGPRPSLPQSDQRQSPIFSTQRSAATTAATTTNFPGVEGPGELASTSAGAEESSLKPRPRADSAAKDQPPRRKGVGLYAGNWEYVTDEEKVPEYLKVAEKTADVPGRTTRRAFAKLTSTDNARDSRNLMRSALENQVRKSGRARNSVNYAALSASEDLTGDAAASQLDLQTENSAARPATQMSPSTSASSLSNRSTLMPDATRRSTSTSFATNAEQLDQLDRPKLSWNAIVYKVLALADGPLSFTQLTQDIKDQFPFFQDASQEKVLKSGLKNPLYFHEAFCKGGMINGKQTWGLRPGVFVDKKTGDVLTPQPRNPIISPGDTVQVHGKGTSTPVQVTPKVSQPFHPHSSDSRSSNSRVSHPRSSNPRFGREILNSPEIPDSQGARPPTPSPQEYGNNLDGEHAPHFEEPTGVHEPAGGEQSSLAVLSAEASDSIQSLQNLSQRQNPAGGFVNTTSISETQTLAGGEDESIRDSISSNGHGAAVKEGPSMSILQTAEPSPPPVPSSAENGEVYNNSPTSQFVPAPIEREPEISTTISSNLPENDAPALPEAQLIPPTPTPDTCLIPCSQLDDFGSDGKSRAKEGSYMRVQRWA